MPLVRVLVLWAGLLCCLNIFAAGDIVLLGDESRIALLASCKVCQTSKLKWATPARGASAHEVADMALQARHAVVVIDAAAGPLPVFREHVLIARQAGVPELSMMFTHLPLLNGMPDAKELLELEELEGREVMNVYEMGGDTAMVFYDAPIQGGVNLSGQGIGIDRVHQVLQDPPQRKAITLVPLTARSIQASVYLLTPQESRPVIPLRNGTKTGLWVNGQFTRAVVRTVQPLKPGAVGEITLESDGPVRTSLGSRFLLERDGKVIAIGVVSGGH